MSFLEYVIGSGSGNAAVRAANVNNAPMVRYLPITTVYTDGGLCMISATPSGTLPGITRTAGTSSYLVGVATAGATPATTKMVWELVLPDTYIPGNIIPVVVNCVVPVSTNIVAGSTTLTLNAYQVLPSGAEIQIPTSPTQLLPITTANFLTFNVVGSSLSPSSRVNLELVALVTTTTGGASSVRVNSIGYTA